MMVRSVRPEDLEMPLEGFSDFITPLDRFLVRTHVYTHASTSASGDFGSMATWRLL
jgi:hypothetical protein